MAELSQQVHVMEGYKDNYNGVIVKPEHYGQVSPGDFHQMLTASLTAWKSDGKRGVWLTILIGQSELIPMAAKEGFEFHHSKPDRITMTKWLPENEPSSLPIYATHNIGVGGLVVNDKDEVLVVQEKWLRKIKVPHWKFPGGVCDPGEDIWKTAMRETFEETGIRTEFVCLLMFRHMHGYNWGIDDIYFSCLLRPLNTDIQANSNEIAAAKWIHIDEYIADPNTFPSNMYVVEAYKESMKNGQMVQPTVYPHFISGKPNMSIYHIKTCDPTQTCDLTTKKWTWALKDYVEQALKPPDRPKANI